MSPLLSFLQWGQLHEQTTTGTITHIPHIEELLLVDPNGIPLTLQFFSALEQLLHTPETDAVSLSLKIDGAPSVLVGTDPGDGKFFVSLKRGSKLIKSESDFEAWYGDQPELQKVLRLVWSSLRPALASSDAIVQGDVVFTPPLKTLVNIDGIPTVTFCPNTITYGVPADSKLGRAITDATLGITFHTTYTGTSMAQLTATPGSRLRQEDMPSRVVCFPNQYTALRRTGPISPEDRAEIRSALEQLQAYESKLTNNSIIAATDASSSIGKALVQFQHHLVRQGVSVTLTPDHFLDAFEKFIVSRGTFPESLRKEIVTKTDAIHAVLEWQDLVIRLKNLLLHSLKVSHPLTTYYDSPDGLRPGEHEGFVATLPRGEVIKLVDRTVFSHLNFTQGRFQAPS